MPGLGSHHSARTDHWPADNYGQPSGSRCDEPLRDLGAAKNLLTAGTEIGEFSVEQFLSRGATAEVYLARSRQSGEVSAIRVLRAGLTDHEVDQFQLEAIAYGMFNSPHLPKLYGVGRLSGGNSEPYMALEYMRGRSLSSIMANGLSVPACIELGIQLMKALHDCHVQGFIHCDVKPRNIIVDESGPVLKLVDFGICQRIRHTRATPAPAMAVGTPPYMSPEQIKGEPLDLRTDIYSAGVVLYQALTGRLPFEGATAEEVMSHALEAPILPPRLLRERCPLELERVIMRALCRNSRFRYSSARLVAGELQWVLGKHGLPHGRAAWMSSSSQFPPADTASLADTRSLSSVRPRDS